MNRVGIRSNPPSVRALDRVCKRVLSRTSVSSLVLACNACKGATTRSCRCISTWQRILQVVGLTLKVSLEPWGCKAVKEISVRLKGNLFPYHACSLSLVHSNIQDSWDMQGGGISYEKLSRVVKRVVQLSTMIKKQSLCGGFWQFLNGLEYSYFDHTCRVRMGYFCMSLISYSAIEFPQSRHILAPCLCVLYM